MKKTLLNTLIVLLGIGLSGFLYAQSSVTDSPTIQIPVSITIDKGCEISDTDNAPVLDFGHTGSLQEGASANTQFMITCTQDTQPSIAFDMGLHEGKNNNRNLQLSSNNDTNDQPDIAYQLLHDDKPVTTTPQPITADSPYELTANIAAIPKESNLTPGKYTDSVMATISWAN